MKALDVLGTGVKKVAQVAAAIVGGTSEPQRKDPFYSDLERREEINARSWRSPGSWLGLRRRGWLR